MFASQIWSGMRSPGDLRRTLFTLREGITRNRNSLSQFSDTLLAGVPNAGNSYTRGGAFAQDIAAETE